MRAILVPENPSEPIEEVELPDDMAGLLTALKEKVGGYIEIVRTKQLHSLVHGVDCVTWSHRPTVVMVVNEDGWQAGCRINDRASYFYPGDIVGHAVLVAEVNDDEGGYDIAGLPDVVTVDKVQQFYSAISNEI